MSRADEKARSYYTLENFDTLTMLELGRKCFSEGYNQAEQDTIERACQILYDWNKQMTEMFGAKAVLSCNQFTIDVDRFRKILELE